MLVSKKHELGIGLSTPTNLSAQFGKHHKVASIDWKAIFYTYASPDTEFLGWDDYVDANTVVMVSKS